MNNMIKLLSLLLATNALATDTYSFKYGLSRTTKSKIIQEMATVLQFKRQLNQPFYYTISSGIIHASNAIISKDPDVIKLGEYRKDQFIITPQLGINVKPYKNMFISVAWGPGVISNPDQVNSSYFNFFNDVSIGFEDEYAEFGLVYTHISNANIKLPNLGRDFFNL